ncbi:vWA domain-containing protein [Deinococcus misasensis]|uniref:vWA domain-containing protein n=1 Tax=Deinococcus misasensis TaxID=392413 RepID=UPI000A483F5A|nr:VWA domain-containing protein [Deinococcus misasensis]
MKQLPRAVALLGALLITSASAQTHVELILDASGSMYNKLSETGQTRIQVARDVLTSFIGGLPEDPELNVGLRIYGAKTVAGSAGSCEDSELVLPMQGINRAALQDTVKRTNPKGATPIAYSLLKAAEDFPNTPGKKLIVLVTDGQESCGGNLKTAMEAFKTRGIDVDLRIIGIDLDERAERSFAGIGTFENARNAATFAAALGRAVQTVTRAEERTLPVTVQLTRDGQPDPGGSRVYLNSTIDRTRQYDLTPTGRAGEFSGAVPAGSYEARVESPGQEPRTYSGINVNVGAANRFSFETRKLDNQVKLTVSNPNPLAGSLLEVLYSGAPETGKRWIALTTPDAPEGNYLNWEDVGATSGKVSMAIPEVIQPYIFRYHLSNPDGSLQTLGQSAPFTPQKATATLEAPKEVMNGAEVLVKWTGPANPGDYVTIVPVNAPEGTYTDYFNAVQGADQTLNAPVEAGQYEVRYVTRQGTTLARASVQVKMGEYTVSGPTEAIAGSVIEVAWTGGGVTGDYVTIVPSGASDGAYTDYKYTRNDTDGKAELRTPLKPGEYEIRYNTERGKVYARAKITLKMATYGLKFPDEAPAGGTVTIEWTGPNSPDDYITIVPKNAPDGTYMRYEYTRSGNPLKIVAPGTPGMAEVRYMSENGNVVLFRKDLKLTAGAYDLDFPRSAMAGSRLQVKWTGIGAELDYITVVPKGAAVGTYMDYVYVRAGNPVQIQLPKEPGEYEIRYVNEQQNNMVMHSEPLTITRATATLKALASVNAGATFTLNWTGPAGEGDYLTIAAKGDADDAYIFSHYVEGNLQVQMTAPNDAGNYEIRYVTADGTVLARIPLTVK